MSIGSMRKDLSEMTWDAVGITGLITNYSYVKDLIRYLREFQPRAPIVVGGALGSSIPEIMLRKAGADICVIGEGEETAVELFRTLGDEMYGLVNGLAYLNTFDGYITTVKRKPIKDIDTLPLPAYDLFDTDRYAMNPVGSTINKTKWVHDSGASVEVPMKSMNLIGTRGCPWNCAFCYHDFMGQGYRSCSPNKLMEEIFYLQQTYGINFFLMASDCFVVKKHNVVDFCIQAETWNRYDFVDSFQWECSARVDTVDEDLLLRMKDAGCQMVCYGIESGNQQMLDRLGKGFNVERAKHVVKYSKKIFGQVDCTFIVGTPGETKQTLQDTIDFCKECEISPQAVFFLTPYPGTPLWGEVMRIKPSLKWESLDHQEQFILEKLSDNEQGQEIAHNFTDFSDEELKDLRQWVVEETGAWNK
jgi:radical SAM superfamily enzyme YgiQ (UPF0313 family)